NLTQQVVNDINQAVVRAGAAGLFVDVPVVDSRGLTAATCGSFQFNRTGNIAGYVKMRLLGATASPNKSILASVDCTHTSAAPPGGSGFFGYRSLNPFIVQ